MTDHRQAISWRPDPELKALIEEFARNTHRSVSQAVTTLVTAALAGDVSYGPAKAIEAQFQRLLDARHNALIEERHQHQATEAAGPVDVTDQIIHRLEYPEAYQEGDFAG